ncbi:MAG: AMP-binding protein, partial [Pyrinomonadaceae bacterium]|nr:AMP-binding protein [Pyrinomonadaceae bacterium]
METSPQKIGGKAFALSKSQLSIWAGQAIDPDCPLYNMIYRFDLFGAVDIERFSKAFDLLVQSCDSLRIVFDSANGEPSQRVVVSGFDLDFVDLSDERADAIDRWIDARATRRLDLSKCTFDSALIKLEDEHFVWFLNQHHLAIDASSFPLLFEALGRFYENPGEELKGEIRIPSYEKYIRSLPTSPIEREYWNSRVAEMPAPRDLRREGFDGFSTASRRIVRPLQSEIVEKLKKIAAESRFKSLTEDMTLFNIFATVLFAYQHRLSDVDLAIIGSPIHNRISPEHKKTPGQFIEFFPLEAWVSAEDSFVSLFKKVRDASIKFLRHAKAEASVPELYRKFNTVLNYIDTGFRNFGSIPAKAEWIHPRSSDAGHQLRVHVYNDKARGDLSLIFDVNEAAFGEISEYVPEHYFRLLEALLDEPNKKISMVSFVTGTEYETEIGFDRNPPSEFQPVLKEFSRIVLANPKKTAISDEEVSIDFKTLDAKSNQIANLLRGKGFANGDRAVIHSPRSIETIAAVLGVLKAGGVFVPVAAGEPEARLQKVVSDCRARA